MLAVHLIARLAVATAPPLTLEAVLKDVSERAPLVAVEREAVNTAEAAVRIAGAWEDPQLSVMGENLPLPGRGMDMDDPMSPMLTYRFAQPLNLFGRRTLAKDSARARAEQARALLRRTEFDAKAQAVAGFYELWMNERMSEVLSSQIDLMQQMRESAKARYGAGLMMAHHDVLRAGSEIASMRAEFNSLKDERLAVAAMLNVVRGRPVDDELGTAEPPPRKPIPERERLLAEVAQRPEYVRAEQMRVESEAELGLARRMYLPMVMAESFYQQRLDGKPSMFGGGVTFSVPLWFFDRQRNEVAMAQAMVHRAEKDIEAMRVMTESELVAAWSRVRAADRSLEALETSALPAARETVDADRAAYVSGTGTFINLLESLTALRDVEVRRIRAVVARETALYELQRLVAHSPSTEVNR